MNADFIKSPDETLVWQGRPAFMPYILNRLIESLDSLKFLAFVWIATLVCNWVAKYELNRTGLYLFTVTILCYQLFRLVKGYLDCKATSYYLTNWRLIIENKNAAIMVKSLDKSWIKSVDMTQSKTEQKFDTGTILIDVGEVNREFGGEEKVIYRLEAIPEPDNVLRML